MRKTPRYYSHSNFEGRWSTGQKALIFIHMGDDYTVLAIRGPSDTVLAIRGPSDTVLAIRGPSGHKAKHQADKIYSLSADNAPLHAGVDVVQSLTSRHVYSEAQDRGDSRKRQGTSQSGKRLPKCRTTEIRGSDKGHRNLGSAYRSAGPRKFEETSISGPGNN
ncbi:hypothetical protein P692DRAFT_201808630 [Suillus brevipes Sb2]|nr:hypothetical protein P692DRAFT_201808630 [Suillus brevipes Sb2]